MYDLQVYKLISKIKTSTASEHNALHVEAVSGLPGSANPDCNMSINLAWLAPARLFE
ncbi:hypothetical protein [Massilia genomosp. 1]|uniref:hypothetical protein n=1 Tax=Massilia genomosp. 1 TaxID=2609280 RepID=UPI001420541C|nr:hypothetical protein [Massilia genomosp. 1]